MSDFQVRENKQNKIMKTFFKTLAGFLSCIIFLASCQKEQSTQPIQVEPLESRKDFRQFVANDLFSRVQFAGYLSSKLTAAQYRQLRSDLSSASEAALPGIFQKYSLDYAFFQQHTIDRIAQSVLVVRAVPSLSALQDQQLDQQFNESYQKVAAEMLQQVKERMAGLKILEGQRKIDFAHSPTQNRVEVLGVNTLLHSEEKLYFSNGNEGLLPEGEAVGNMAIYMNELSKKENITGSEVWKCFKQALGFGVGSAFSIVGWSERSAGLIVADVIKVATKWAIRNLGWVGAAITIVSFGDCLLGVQ